MRNYKLKNDKIININTRGRMTIPKVIREHTKIHCTGSVQVHFNEDNSILITKAITNPKTEVKTENKTTLIHSCINELIKLLKGAK